MPIETQILLAVLIFVVGLLYSTVGHAGASGYLAVLVLGGFAHEELRTTALVLNILVAAIGTAQFAHARYFDWRLFWPFALGSVPFAFFGGRLKLPPEYYSLVLGAVLLFSAWRIAAGAASGPLQERPTRYPPLPIALMFGIALGYLSGLTGVGGGIFLSPLLLLAGWADPKRTAAVSAAFILVNSISGLAGMVSEHRAAFLPMSTMGMLGIAAVVGGAIGSHLGSRRFDTRMIRRVLAVVLIVAGGKLVWDGGRTIHWSRPPTPDHIQRTSGITPRSRTSADPADGSRRM